MATTTDIVTETLDPEEILALFYALGRKIKTLQFPAAYVKEFDEDINGDTVTTLRCGNCHYPLDEERLVVVDWDARWTYGADIDFESDTVSFNYDGETNYEFLHYRCESCNKPVSLPDGWKEN